MGADRQNDATFAEKNFIVDRVQNITDSAEGPVTPPRQVGSNRVPLVSNLRILTTVPFLGGTTFTIAFDDVPGSSYYNLYYTAAGTGALNNAGTCRRSPATVTVNLPENTTVAISVQTVLRNGFLSTITDTSTVVGKTTAASVTPADLTGLNIVFGGNDMDPAGLVPFTAATPTFLTTDAQLQFDAGTGFFANSAGAPTAAITTDRTVAFGVDPTPKVANFNINAFWFTPVDTSGGAVSGTLPAAAGFPGQWYVMKKITSDANAITILPTGADTIDGAASKSTTGAYGLLSVVRSSPTSWSII